MASHDLDSPTFYQNVTKLVTYDLQVKSLKLPHLQQQQHNKCTDSFSNKFSFGVPGISKSTLK